MQKSTLKILVFLMLCSFNLSSAYALGAAQEIGNTSGNLNNRGIYVSVGDWIYYCSLSRASGLYKMKSDGTNKVKISDEYPQYINLLGDYIFYSAGDTSKLTKIKTDGTEKTVLDKDAFHINIVDNWIYYSKGYSQDGNVYKMKIDGTGRTKVIGDPVSEIVVSGGWIYYTSYYSKLFKVDTDGKSKTRLISGRSVSELNVSDNWLYFNYNGALYKMKTDGTEKTKLSSDDARYINVSGQWIYYSNYSDFKKRLTKIKTDGTGKTVLSNHKASFIHVVGKYLFYYNPDKNQTEKVDLEAPIINYTNNLEDYDGSKVSAEIHKYMLPYMLYVSSYTKIFVQGQEIPLEIPPVIVNDNMLLPLRKVAEALNLKVTWAKSGEVTLTRSDTSITLGVGKKAAIVRGTSGEKEIPLNIPCIVVDGTALVPLRFVSESMGAVVNQDRKLNVVNIITK